uniref:Type 11 methyltransferase n=1 Tax=uncultured bacterium UPO76 TaxID=1776993 RepID=A0A140DZZ1_9BACT|nr:type 11 methyltransferase [uncultured bacterium UPO76]
MSWEIFEEAAVRYGPWYATPRGRRADRAERALLAWLLGWFPDAHRVLEIGCGTGHFTQWLAARGCAAIGLDRSPAMLREARTLVRHTPLVLVVLNRCSLGALSRRWGPQSRGSLLAGARDFSRARLRDALEKAAGERLLGMYWRSTLLPRPLDRLLVPVPAGDVLGVAVELAGLET